MNKLEVLMQLNQLDLKLSREQDELRRLHNDCADNIPLYYGFYGKMSGIKWTRGELEKVRSAIVNTKEPSEITETCPHCESEVTLQWDVKDRGYKAYCPVCGKKLMLCFACRDDGYECDYNSYTGRCRWNHNSNNKNN